MSTAVEQIITPYHQTDRFTLYEGDCRSVLPIFADNSFDSIVTDPPAGISFMGKDWDHHKGGRDQWVAWLTEVMRECLRVLKPGGHALVWAIPRTSHWTGWAIESAGFEVRDRVSHLFGSGFPKSLDISKQLDARAGAERQTVGKYLHPDRGTPHGNFRTDNNRVAIGDFSMCEDRREITSPTADAAKQWDGWGTALKPACEDWWLCRKPLEGTVAQNVLEHGTGGLNIAACRVEGEYETRDRDTDGGASMFGTGKGGGPFIPANGRWPSNICHDGSEEVLAGFPDTSSGLLESHHTRTQDKQVNCYGAWKDGAGSSFAGQSSYGDSGSAARFFFSPDAPKHDKMSECRNTFAGSVADLFRTFLVTNGDIAPSNVEDSQRERLVQNVRSAGVPCDSCATHIAHGLAKIKSLAFNPPLLQACLGSIGISKNSILNHSLVSVAEEWANTDIIPTTQSLLKLFGCALLAIGENTKPESRVSDNGPSRFLYVPKASQEDRNEGLDDLPIQSAGAVTDRKDGSAGLNSPRAGAGRTNGSRNAHPTVKPISLARYLCRLITPPNGLVLDPFTGSGSLGIGALLEGFSFVGIEKEPEYCEIAKRRLQYWEGHYQPRLFRHDGTPSLPVCDTTDREQLSLLGDSQSPDQATS